MSLIEAMDSVYVSHMSIIRLHEEFSRTHDDMVKNLLDYLRNNEKVKIWSGGFKAQLEVRNVIDRYFELASTIALSIEKECLVVFGDPEVDMEIVNHFGNRLVRVDDFVELMRE